MASACTSCRTSLMGKRYVLRDEAPTCLTCYETSFANKCEKCKQVISTDAKVSLWLQFYKWVWDCSTLCGLSSAAQRFFTSLLLEGRFMFTSSNAL